jgi:MATE family multidrug resistance protein
MRPAAWRAPLAPREFRELLAIGWPTGVQLAFESGLFSAAAVVMGWLGVVALAAHQIALSCAATTFMFPLGIAQALTVRVGHAVGRGDRDGLRRAAFAGYALVVMTQLATGSTLFLANDAIAGLYTNDAAVAALAATLLLMAATFQFPDGIQVLSIGALRGLKDTRAPMLIAALAYWGIGMPLGAVLGLGVGALTPALGPKGMWIGLIAGLTVAAILLSTRFVRLSGRIPVGPQVVMTDGG